MTDQPSTPETTPGSYEERPEGQLSTPATPRGADGLDDGRESDDADTTWSGPLVPDALMEAIHQAGEQQKQDTETFAALPFAGPTVAECAEADARWWGGEKDGER